MATNNSTVIRGIDHLLKSGTSTGLEEGELLRRFASGGDELAFEVLLKRHGPMVLGVCRRILVDPHDADDAFQATFLILVRRAREIRPGSPLGPWLHGVARKVARRAGAEAGRRRIREQTGDGSSVEIAGQAPGSTELRWLLDEEIDRLPEKYRRPLILCHLEGHTHEEAATILGWPVGTVRGRLARARERMRDRLARRGIADTVIPFAPQSLSLLDRSITVADGSEALTRMAMRLRLIDSMTTEAVSARVLALSGGVLQTMFMTKLKAMAAIILFGALAVGGGVQAYHFSDSGQDRKDAGNSGVKEGSPRPEQHKAERTPKDSAPHKLTTKDIQELLGKPMLLDIPNETTLEAVLKRIYAATEAVNGQGIPIYVDPVGLQEAEGELKKPIQVVLPIAEKRPLKEILHALFRPLGLDYWVANDFLKISSRERAVDHKISQLQEQIRKLTERLDARAN